jgi:hypothetical protein
MKYLIGLFFASLTIYSFGQTKNSNDIEGLTINPSIKKEAEENIKDLKDFEKLNRGIQIYESKVKFEFYENDSLIASTNDNPKSIISKSFYLWRGDTLSIDGGIGLFGGGGFSIKLVKNKATVYHMLSSDEFPTYAYGEKTDLIYRLEVPCHDIKVILSGLPKKGENQIIYGYVEFKSDNYFAGQGTIDGKEVEPRTKSRSNMKMYFRSGQFDL